MSDGTHIEWSDASWNPIRAGSREKAEAGFGYGTGWQCQRVSPGCQNCYAEAINKRLGTGLGYDAKGMAASVPFLDEKTLVQPLHWKKPRKIFVCSMTDIAGEWVPDEWLDRMFAVMALTPQHTYQVLTKRPARLREYLSPVIPELGEYRGQPVRDMLAVAERVQRAMREMVPWDAGTPGSLGLPQKTYHWPGWPLPNVWIGTSVEDQERADERIPELLATPAAVRFLSCEPLLGPVDLALGHKVYSHYDRSSLTGFDPCWLEGENGIDWVIVGGESGPRSRPMDLAWARSLVAQCQAAGVAAFVKQLGSNPVGVFEPPYTPWKARKNKGGDMAEWPEDLRVREWPVQQRSFTEAVS